MAEDPREHPLNDVARRIMVQSNYDPHYSAIEERVIMETKLFLARVDAMEEWQKAEHPLISVPYREVPKILEGQTGGTAEVFLPIPMILWCPNCGVQHIDAEEPHKPDCRHWIEQRECDCGRWTNPPHRSHLCGYCDHVWRPSDVLTTGVHEIADKLGSNDSQPVIRRVIDRTARFQPQWRHKPDGKLFMEIARGEMRTGDGLGATVTRVICYRGADMRVRFCTQTEFDDGRFERITDAP